MTPQRNKSHVGLPTTVAALIMALLICAPAMAEPTKGDVQKAQDQWGQDIVEIGRIYTAGGDYAAIAKEMIQQLYAYDRGPVLFKPTKAADAPFRLTKESALSYFVGHDPAFPEDKGFALQPWEAVSFENAGILVEGDTAVAMGNYFFTPPGGKPVKVEYTFVYRQGADGLRIIAHHSSLPYQPH